MQPFKFKGAEVRVVTKVVNLDGYNVTIQTDSAGIQKSNATELCDFLCIDCPEWAPEFITPTDLIAIGLWQEDVKIAIHTLNAAEFLARRRYPAPEYSVFHYLRSAAMMEMAWRMKATKEIPPTEKESAVSDTLAVAVQGKREIVTPSGRIDVLSDSQIIEVKRAKNWRGGLGQVLDYAQYYPDRELRLHLFDIPSGFDFTKVLAACAAAGVIATWEAAK